ncbi:MAG: bacteriohemerythrin [Rhodospirillaceae bacterium]
MSLMSWNEKMSVGVVAFDTEHKKLVEMLNQLFDAVQAGKGRDVLGEILDKLIEYTKSHFAYEERIMGQNAYPDLEAHKKEHEELTRKVIDIQKKYHSGATVTLSMEVLTFLKDWLLKHIQGTDKKYTPYLNAKGIR